MLATLLRCCGVLILVPAMLFGHQINNLFPNMPHNSVVNFLFGLGVAVYISGAVVYQIQRKKRRQQQYDQNS
jgi:sugar phosphate permease